MADYTLSAKITADISDFAKNIDTVTSKLDSMASKTGAAFSDIGSTLENIGSLLTGIETAIAGVVGAGITSCVKEYASFEDAMARVQALSGVTAEELETLSDRAQEMGAATRYTATEAAEAMQYMALAGWDVEEIYAGIPAVMDLAAASGEDLASVSNILTDGLTALGMTAGEAGDYCDVLAAASTNSNTTIAQMGEAMQNVGSIAGAMGYNIEDISLAMGLMANSSVKGAKAGTALKAMLTRLAAPTDETAALLDELGISMTDENGNMKDLSTTIDELREAFSGMTEEEKVANANTLAGMYGMNGLLAIVNASAEDYEQLTAAISDSSGACAEMADTMNNTLVGQFELLKSQVSAVATTIGEELAPYVYDLIGYVSTAVEVVQNVVNAFIAAKDASGDWYTALDAAAGAIQGMCNTGEMPAFLQTVADAVRAVVDKLKELNDNGISLQDLAVKAGEFALVGPILLTVGKAFSAIGTGIGTLSAAGNFISGIFSSLGGTASTVLGTIAGGFENLSSIFASLPGELSKVSGVASQVFGILSEFAPIVINALGFAAIGGAVLAGLGLIQQNFGDKIQEIIDFVVEKAPEVLQSFTDGITEKLPELMAAGGTLVNSLLEAITILLPDILTAGTNLLAALIEGFAENLPELIPAAVELIVTLTTGLLEQLPALIDCALALIVALVEGLMNALPELIAAAPEIILTICDTLLTKLPDIITAAEEIIMALVDGLIDALPELSSSAFEIIVKLAEMLIDNLPEIVETAGTLLSTLGQGLIDAIPDLVGDVSEIIDRIKDEFLNVDWAEVGASIAKTIGNALIGIVNTVIGLLNGIIDGVNLIPNINIPNIPTIPYLAHGTSNFAGGYAVINENGRGELVNLPDGSQVIPHDISAKYATEAAKNVGTSAVYIDYTALAEAITAGLGGAEMRTTIELDGRTVASQITPFVDRNLAKSAALATRT